MKLPETPARGSMLDSTWGRQVVEYLRALTPSGRGVGTTSNGTTIIGGDSSRREIKRSSTNPFKLTGLIIDGNAYITVSPGLVDNIVPTIDGTSLVVRPAPKLSVSGATGQLWIKNTVDAKGIITASIIENGDAMPADTTSLAYRLLGSFTSAEGQFTSVVSLLDRNQTHKRCGGFSTWGSA